MVHIIISCKIINKYVNNKFYISLIFCLKVFYYKKHDHLGVWWVCVQLTVGKRSETILAWHPRLDTFCALPPVYLSHALSLSLLTLVLTVLLFFITSYTKCNGTSVVKLRWKRSWLHWYTFYLYYLIFIYIIYILY